MEYLKNLHPVALIIITIAVLVAVRYLLVFGRHICLWYWRIDVVVSLLEEQNRLLRMLTDEPKVKPSAAAEMRKEPDASVNDPEVLRRAVEKARKS